MRAGKQCQDCGLQVLIEHLHIFFPGETESDLPPQVDVGPPRVDLEESVLSHWYLIHVNQEELLGEKKKKNFQSLEYVLDFSQLETYFSLQSNIFFDLISCVYKNLYPSSLLILGP